MGVQLTLPPSEHQQQEALQVIMNNKVLVIFTLATVQFVTGDIVPVYSGGPPDYGASAAQDAFNALGEAIPGEPGEDYPIYSEVPETSFTCDGQVEGGYYSDPEAECQAFHICGGGSAGSLIKYSFLCPNGSLFNQEYFVCDWWFNVDCSQAENFYFLNDEIAAEREANSPGLGQYGGNNGGQRGQGGQGGYQGSGGRGSGSRGSSRNGSGSSGYSGAASTINNDYSAPSGFSTGGSYSASSGADSDYGAPSGADSGYGAPSGADSGYSAPSGANSGYSAPTGAGTGYSAPSQTFAGVQPARHRSGRRGGRRQGRK